MNVLVKTVGGGIFSTFTIAIQQILNDIPNVDEIDNIYIELDNDRYHYSERILGSEMINPFDYVLDQKKINPDIILTANFIKTYINHNDLYGTEELKKLQLEVIELRLQNKIYKELSNKIY
jgi:hypothetical protein